MTDYDGRAETLTAQLGEVVAERDRLVARVDRLAAELSVLRAELAVLSPHFSRAARQLEALTAPSPTTWPAHHP